MILIDLDESKIIEIYNSRMVYDFPKDELRPLQMIIQPYRNGIYSCYGITEDNSDDILGYAYFIKHHNHYLLDYFAISKDKRDSGIGSKFLELINEKFRGCDSLIVEVENPEYAQNDESYTVQIKRQNFYLNNGFVNTNVKVMLFGVNYNILELKLGDIHSVDEVKRIYKEHYMAILPEEIYNKMLVIKDI